MSEIDHAATAQLVADWVRGEPDDTRQMRRTRLLAYHRVWQHPYQLGMFLTQVAFDRAMAGAAPGAGPREWQQLTRRGGDGWQRRGQQRTSPHGVRNDPGCLWSARWPATHGTPLE
jgi:hypothetical protein